MTQEEKDVAQLQILLDKVVGEANPYVETTLQRGVYKLYTEVWLMTAEQLDRIREEVNVIELMVDGGSLLLTGSLKKK